jgi:hypothetical protein
VTRADKPLTTQGYLGAINIVNIGYKHEATPELTAIVTLRTSSTATLGAIREHADVCGRLPARGARPRSERRLHLFIRLDEAR